MRRFPKLVIGSPTLVGGSLALTLLGAGCASTQGARPAGASDVADDSSVDRVSSLVKKQDEQQQRIAELEARLALLENEARSQRNVASELPRGETIRIGAKPRASEPAPAAETAAQDDGYDPTPAARGKRERIPTLRLYGMPAASEEGSPASFGQTPMLPVAPLPEDRARALATGEAPSEGALDPKEEYRAALRMLREQKYDDALAAFDRFITAHPDHGLVMNALYWRGEAHYAKRDYQLARESFETLLARFATSDKAADSLLKVGLCLRRMGDEAQAKVYFKRVQEKFPKSDAAQIASREGST